MVRVKFPKIASSFCMLFTLFFFALPAAADNDDPPSRVARLAYARGSVSFQPSGTDDWVTAAINRPVTVGDKFWSDNDGRAELQLDGSLLRLSNNTGFSFLNLNDNTTQIELSAGTLLVRVRRLDENEIYEIDAPNLAFSILRPGLYRITVDEAGDSTAISVRSGEGEVTGGGAAYTINARDSYVFSGTEQLYADREDLREDQFESWAAIRDRRWETSRSAHYVSTDVVGYEDLDDHGDWRQTPDYGNVWFPRLRDSDWAPYHYGHWSYIEPWGYTWVDDEPWGFAPFHYGRWVNYQGAWGWVPAPPRSESAAYVRPVYAPALVAWVGDGSGTIAWFALGPREVYVPSYPVSRNYVNNVNVSNTTVNTTVVNNYYNTTVVNKTTTVTNVNYVNRSVPGAVAATTPQTFTTAQPVAKNLVKVDQRTVASAPVKAVAPPVVPAKQAVLGNAPATAKPPANVQTRTVVAKAAPPPPPPSFEKRQAAIQNNGGKPLSPAQMRQIQPAAAARPSAPVKVAPAAKPSTTPPPPPPNRPAPSSNKPAPSNPTPQPNRPAERPNPATPPPQPAKPPAAAPPATNRPPEQPRENPSNPATPNKPSTPATPNRPATPTPAPTNRPPEPPSERPANPATPNKPTTPEPNRPATPARPNERPPEARPATPPSNPATDRKQQQEQEQMRARQQQEREKLQQQQQQERARAQEQADQAKKQQLERQHQQQTEQLQQKHAQEQKQLEQKQQQERQQKNKPQKPEQPQP